MVDVNCFAGMSDNEMIENAILNRQKDGIVVISSRISDQEPERDFWLLDRAILLPENTTVILRNCKIKLSDRCRDNFFRSANCGMGIEFPERISNIHIQGEGYCVLEGADHPRATGDSSKRLHAPCPHYPEDICRVADWVPEERRTPDKLGFWDVHDHSYGTDAGNPEESQYGDWRGIGILLANVEHFSISNVKIVKSHGWGISLEACSYGRVEKIEFDATMHKEIDGMIMNMENQDGVNLRNGCHHIVVSDITGHTGDDVIALNASANSKVYRPGGSLRNTQVMHNDWTKRETDIHDIIIRNVTAHSYLCYVVRLLAVKTHIYNVVIDGVIDTASDCTAASGTILVGDEFYGENWTDGVRNITISNVVCNSRKAIAVDSFLMDSVISNVINRNPNTPIISVAYENGLVNVQTSNLISSSVD